MKLNREHVITRTSALLASIAVLFNVAVNPVALADGTETLGDPSISIADGTGIVAAGTGMVSQPGSISVNVPASATVKQVILYWEGQMLNDVPGDNTINVGGTEVLGTLIGGQAFFVNNAYSSAFRADITDLNLVSAGANSFNVSGMDFTRASNGAGVLVIYDDGSTTAEIGLRDGVDLAFVNFPEPRKSTIAQTFNFTPAAVDRTAPLAMFFGSVAGSISGAGPDRPTSIEVESGGVTTVYSNLLGSNDGEEWDTQTLSVNIPAGASSVMVQAFSRDDLSSGNLPASLSWITAALAVTPPTTGGGEGCTPGYWKNHTDSWPPTGYSPVQSVQSVFAQSAAFPGIGSASLLEALNFGGGPGAVGGAKILLRAAVASLLNSASPDVEFPRSAADIIADVDAALASGNRSTMLSLASQLDADNNVGCPLN